MSELTRRQRLADLLGGGPWSFDELRRELGVPARELEDDLKHLARTLARGGLPLVVEPASCTRCGFRFRGREPRRFTTPSRCPRCRSERIEGALLSTAGEP